MVVLSSPFVGPSVSQSVSQSMHVLIRLARVRSPLARLMPQIFITIESAAAIELGSG